MKDLKDAINKLDEKLDKTNDRIYSIDITLSKQQVSLDEHIRRSNAIEDVVNYIRENEIKPLKKHAAMLDGALKFLGVIGVVVSIVAGLFQLLSLI